MQIDQQHDTGKCGGLRCMRGYQVRKKSGEIKYMFKNRFTLKTTNFALTYSRSLLMFVPQKCIEG